MGFFGRVVWLLGGSHNPEKRRRMARYREEAWGDLLMSKIPGGYYYAHIAVAGKELCVQG